MEKSFFQDSETSSGLAITDGSHGFGLGVGNDNISFRCHRGSDSHDLRNSLVAPAVGLVDMAWLIVLTKLLLLVADEVIHLLLIQGRESGKDFSFVTRGSQHDSNGCWWACGHSCYLFFEVKRLQSQASGVLNSGMSK